MKKAFLLCFISIWYLQMQAQNTVERLDSLFTAPGNFEHLNGSVLIAESGKVIYQRSFGFSNIQEKKLNTATSSFNIASLTKTFTSTAVLQVVERGKLRLDDNYQKYFPSFPYAEITIRNLLTHTSGLTDLETYFRVLDSLPGKIFTEADIIPSIIRLNRPLQFKPGDKFDYCNINYELLALLIERLTNTSYFEYIQQHIFKPAGMRHSYFNAFPPATPDTNRVTDYMYANLYASGYTSADSVNNLRLKQVMNSLKYLPGDGNIISTEEDLLLYSKALFNGKLLHPQSLASAFTPNRLSNDKDYSVFSNPKIGKLQYGFGWEIAADTSSGKIVSHGGHFPGIWTSFIHNISKDQTVIVYDNTDWSGPYLLSGMAINILNNKPVISMLSKKVLAKVYGQTLVKEGSDAALSKLIELKDDTVHYVFNERDMNTLGYQFMLDHFTAQSLETFKVNTLLYPNSSNAYDSYGDALANNNQNKDAIIMYKKAIVLDPKNTESINKLKKLTERN
ncbi:MAG: serine hydrolase domain-containing protein [Chitinophagaceae bacterium]